MVDRILTCAMVVVCTVETAVAIVIYVGFCALIFVPLLLIAVPVLLSYACWKTLLVMIVGR